MEGVGVGGGGDKVGLGVWRGRRVKQGAPALSQFGRTFQSASHRTYERQLLAAQSAAVRHVQSALPHAQVRWRYHLVLDGFAVALPRSQLAALARVPGVAHVWPNVSYRALR